MIKSAQQSSLTSNIKYASMSAGAVPSNEYLIATTVLTQAEPSVTFDVSTLNGIYKHFRIVAVARSTRTATGTPELLIRQNGDLGANYCQHALYAENSSVSSYSNTGRTGVSIGQTPRDAETAYVFHAMTIDILDPFNTSKYTVYRSFAGRALGAYQVKLCSGTWLNTAAATSFTLIPEADSLLAGSRFSIYGVTA